MVLISANGNNAINLGLTYRKAPNYPPAYDYGTSQSVLLVAWPVTFRIATNVLVQTL